MRQIAATRRRRVASPHLHCCCNKSLALSLSMRCVSRIQTSLNLCDRSQQQNSVAATMIFTCHTICCSNLSHRFVALCVSALKVFSSRKHSMRNTQKMSNTPENTKIAGLADFSMFDHISGNSRCIQQEIKGILISSPTHKKRNYKYSYYCSCYYYYWCCHQTLL